MQFHNYNYFTNIRKYSFSNRVVKCWNDLPQSIRIAHNTNQFKNHLDILPKFVDLFHSFDN